MANTSDGIISNHPSGKQYSYEATYQIGPCGVIVWDAVVRRDGRITGRPSGTITHSPGDTTTLKQLVEIAVQGSAPELIDIEE